MLKSKYTLVRVPGVSTEELTTEKLLEAIQRLPPEEEWWINQIPSKDVDICDAFYWGDIPEFWVKLNDLVKIISISRVKARIANIRNRPVGPEDKVKLDELIEIEKMSRVKYKNCPFCNKSAIVFPRNNNGNVISCITGHAEMPSIHSWQDRSKAE